MIFLYQKHGFWHILETFRNINTINCLNFIKETNIFGYLFWKKLNFPIAKIFITTFLGKYQIFLHQCILRILSCRELFSLPRCQKPERGPDYPDLYQPCWKQEQIRGWKSKRNSTDKNCCQKNSTESSARQWYVRARKNVNLKSETREGPSWSLSAALETRGDDESTHDDNKRVWRFLWE